MPKKDHTEIICILDRDKASNFTADEQGTKGAFVQMNCCTTQTRSKKSKDSKA